jgi:hypothetical protein
MADRFVLVWAGPNEQGLQEAYGSLIEIGISHALEKPILFAYHSGVDLRPFWFAVEASTAVV